MPTKDRVMSKAAEMAMEESELTNCRRNSDEERDDQQSSRYGGKGSIWSSRAVDRMPTKDKSWAEHPRWQGKRQELTSCGKNADEGQGHELSNRNGKGNVRNSRPVERMPTKDRVMSREEGMAREAWGTNVLWK
jgi:hypothetical protein